MRTPNLGVLYFYIVVEERRFDMNPKIIVMSRPMFEKYAACENSELAYAVSITTPGDTRANVNPNSNNKILDILRVSFHDTTLETDYYKPISERQAKRIANYIKAKVLPDNRTQLIIVHCDAGQSRSAGVAAAIMKYIYGTDEPIYGNPRYTPNSVCYRRVLEALMF